MPYCPECGGEFVGGVSECPDCGAALAAAPPEEPIIGGGRPAWPVVLASGDPAVLGAAKSALASVGIPFVVEGEGLQHLYGPGTIGAGYSMVFGPARVRVPPDRADEARTLLAHGAEPEPAPDAPGPEPPEEPAAPAGQRAAGCAGGLAVGVVAGLLGGLLIAGGRDGGEPPAERPHGVIERDEDGDGRVDAVDRYRDGVLRAQSMDRNRDGEFDAWAEFNSLGQEVASRWDENFDGEPDVFWTFHDGWPTASEADFDFDGRIDQWSEWGGHQVLKAQWEDVDRDGRPDTWYEFDDRGLRIAERSDADSDGVPDRWYRYQGNELAAGTLDTDFDGTVDVEITYLHSQPQEAIWQARPGAPARKVLYRHGFVAEELRDRDGDGDYDLRIRYGPFENPVEESELR